MVSLTAARLNWKGLLTDYLYRIWAKPTISKYWKSYDRKSLLRECGLNSITNFDRQILQVLHFNYDTGLVYVHLHSVNILFDCNRALIIKLFDRVNGIANVIMKMSL
ncbi:unnamed protein product [Rotaria socialis]|uniref:Uncharacterized protein n=1 Tax=Rotaria socialis TaxID=392032 RepID=A0A821G221_9BILA|nr:unnamed protein product [Rotaria socialis]CAF3295935.1 unnamed protein product [Rotaria socialis]CAF4423817.1 unnamed protein product [Rotaria socialis]CAF4487344.1 unnamed protein product [Rotaria socialis]CAF4643849.1 unnamed protein product [Rotaria socialis]